MLGDLTLQTMFDRYINTRVMNIKEDDIPANNVEVDEKPLFPDVDAMLKDQAKNMTSKSQKELRNIITNKFSGLKSLTKGKFATLERKIRNANMAIELGDIRKDNLEIEISSMLQKFFSQNTQKPPEMVFTRPMDKYGSVSFDLYQVSPVIESLTGQQSAKKVNLSKRRMFGVSANKIVQGKSPEELREDFEQ